MLRRLSPFFVLCSLLAACSGGGGSSTLTAVPTSNATSGKQSVAVTINIPGASATNSATIRKSLYVSLNTQSASVVIDGGTAVVASLTPASSNCAAATAGSGRTCTINLSAPVGTHSFAINLYASTDGSGAILSQNTVSATIAAGVANVVKIALDGVVASIVVKLGISNPPTGSASTTTLTVNFNDASGAAIVGNDKFVNPITLTDSDSSGATTISKTALSSPADASQLTVAYTGAAIGQAIFSATASGVTSSNIKSATLVPQAPGSTTFVDWPTYGYDSQRTGYNPYTSGITPASLSNLHIAWQEHLKGSTQTQPVIVTNVAGHQALLIIGNFAIAQAYDAVTGASVWQRTLPVQDVQDCGIGGISGTPIYDKDTGALYMAAGKSGTAPNHVELYRLDPATGYITGQVDVTPTLLPGEANYSHSGITLANGRIYLGTGSDCEGTTSGKYTAWRGRVVAVDAASMTLLNTFYTTWSPSAQYGGGGVWAWGGVSADASGNIYVATGNGETTSAAGPEGISPPFAAMPNENNAYAEHLIELSSDLSTVENSNFPGFNYSNGGDLDYAGTPVLFQPSFASGCGLLSATQGKGGTLVINNTQNLSVVNSFKLAVPSSSALYIGNPGFSPATGYVYAAITSSGAGSSMLAPGLAAIGGCGSTIAWNTAFGPDSSYYNGENPRSAPTVTAGGVVLMGTPCTNDNAGGCGAVNPSTVNGALWAVDGKTGSLLGGGKPLIITADNIRMAPSADGLWIYVIDDSGNFYGLTVDASVKAIAAKAGTRVTKQMKFR